MVGMQTEREITQFGDTLIWFGLCIAAAIPVWLVANPGPSPITGLLLPLPICVVGFLLAGAEDFSRETLFACGLTYFAILFSPILIWRPAAGRTGLRILIIAGVLHLLAVAASWGVFFYLFFLTGGLPVPS